VGAKGEQLCSESFCHLPLMVTEAISLFKLLDDNSGCNYRIRVIEAVSGETFGTTTEDIGDSLCH
jgi:hypothetical protein